MAEIHPDPTSTWGASEDYKAAWHAKHGAEAQEATPEPLNDEFQPCADCDGDCLIKCLLGEEEN